MKNVTLIVVGAAVAGSAFQLLLHAGFPYAAGTVLAFVSFAAGEDLRTR